ncbi:cation/H(+) antiporter 15-like [Humulus lupulus]|uniref:cation/H(+) antiporter 15-like n=1 Tax=Humulus lupulus TaxID=3486 RepID=UPI002B4106C1|nr:cation/H(+) antiporter 15-like [Humulus lupulus]
MGALDLNSSVNETNVCTSLENLHPYGPFFQNNPLNYIFPLLLTQLSLSTGAILLTYLLLKPLNQSILVVQILGGLLLGPSVLGQSASFTASFFPLRGFIPLDILSSMGFILYFFLIGVHTDPSVLKKINKISLLIGVSTVLVPYAMTRAFSALLPHLISMNPDESNSLPTVGHAESLVALPTIANLLVELKIMKSEIGRVAMCSSVVSGLFSFTISTVLGLINQELDDNQLVISMFGSVFVFVTFIVFILRPAILWLLQLKPVEASLNTNHFIIVVVLVLMTGFSSQAIGLHTCFGPLILGITIPAGQPVGSGLDEKLHMITYWIFLPIFFLKNGLMINIFKIDPGSHMIIQLVALVGALGKFIGAYFTSRQGCKMPIADAITLGLVMTNQGLLELGLFKMLRRTKLIDTDTFASMYLSMLIVSGLAVPIIKRLYDPSRRYVVYKRRTVMDSISKPQLRLLVCVHDEEIAYTTINILEALNPRVESQLAVCVLHLVEIVGHTIPILIPHKLTEKSSFPLGSSKDILEAFRTFKQSNLEFVSVYPYSTLSPCTAMHDQVCTLALDKKSSLVIIPFHKRYRADGTVESYQKASLIMNKNVLDKVPCSVVILIDRGLFRSSLPVLESSCQCRVGVVFLGGADDREALAIGARMADHPKITLTMTRLVADGDFTGNDLEERRVDNESLSEFRQAMISNHRVTYIEEVVRDGRGTAAVICSMENSYEIILVGRNHDKRSPLMSGFDDCGDCAELGAIGEILASSHFKGNTTILVVQQHPIVVNEHKSIKPDHGVPYSINDEEEMPIQGRSP